MTVLEVATSRYLRNNHIETTYVDAKIENKAIGDLMLIRTTVSPTTDTKFKFLFY